MEIGGEVVKIHGRVHRIGVRPQLPQEHLLLVVFVPDLAHQLLQKILHGDDAAGAAALVYHHRHMGLGLL